MSKFFLKFYGGLGNTKTFDASYESGTAIATWNARSAAFSGITVQTNYYPTSDGTRGTPRIDYITAGPRVGKYKIIKVV